MKISLPLTIGLHLGLIALIFPWLHSMKFQLQQSQPVIQAYVAHEAPQPQVLPAKLGLVKAHKKSPHKAQVQTNQTHWPKLNNQQIKSLLMTLNQEIDAALAQVNWTASLDLSVNVQFVLEPNNEVTDIRFEGPINAHEKQLLTAILQQLPPLNSHLKHGPLPIALPIRIGHNAQPFNPLGNL